MAPQSRDEAADPSTEDDDPRLPATSWAVLGMLSFEQELSGYDIKKWADWSLKAFYWSPSFSQIYGELKRLERHGYVTSRTVMQDEVRGKRVYAITPTGREAVRTWARTAPVEVPVLKHGVLLRVWLGHLTDPTRLREIVTEHRDNSERRRTEAAVDAQAAHNETAWAYPEIALKWAERYHAAERDLAEQMLRDLDDLEGSGRATSPEPLPAGAPTGAPRAHRGRGEG
ncbi:PadR family transcriptional regulator [Catenulispora yoronensis]|uniref:PadR family transcriptional regulator n=1 Tax=Catenulispora yoronensis TaxID=450799 RepID=A0ABN2V1C4_9ACTN